MDGRSCGRNPTVVVPIDIYRYLTFERKYSPMVVKSVIRTPIYGVPDPEHITTAESHDAYVYASLHAPNERLLKEGGESTAFARALLHALQLLPQAFND